MISGAGTSYSLGEDVQEGGALSTRKHNRCLIQMSGQFKKNNKSYLHWVEVPLVARSAQYVSLCMKDDMDLC